MTGRRVFLIEFNELCPSLLDRFIAAGMLPNFQKFREQSAVFTTDCSEDIPNLEPWIQWVSVHSGMPFSEHGIFRLGQGQNLQAKLLGSCIADAGLHVGICSSMNANYGGDIRGYVIPDPWAGASPHPVELTSYYDIVRRQVQESSRQDGGLTVKDAFTFLLFLLRNGLSASTATATIRQMAGELVDKGTRWRRPALLDQLQYDVFRSLNAKYKVQFGTFFSNSTAHYQHYYWRNMDPQLFEDQPAQSDHASLSSAVLVGYQDMDRLLGRFMRDYKDALLVLCTALSQQPWVDSQKVTYRPKNFDALLKFAGISPKSVAIEPVMAEQFHVVCADTRSAAAVLNGLNDLKIDGHNVMFARQEGRKVFAGCWITEANAQNRLIARGRDAQTAKFDDLFYRIHSVRSGKHHPDGVLWFRTGIHKTCESKVALTTIAPTILSYFGILPPASMRAIPLPI